MKKTLLATNFDREEICMDWIVSTPKDLIKDKTAGLVSDDIGPSFISSDTVDAVLVHASSATQFGISSERRARPAPVVTGVKWALNDSIALNDCNSLNR
jgi:hypothetical protein